MDQGPAFPGLRRGGRRAALFVSMGVPACVCLCPCLSTCISLCPPLSGLLFASTASFGQEAAVALVGARATYPLLLGLGALLADVAARC